MLHAFLFCLWYRTAQPSHPQPVFRDSKVTRSHNTTVTHSHLTINRATCMNVTYEAQLTVRRTGSIRCLSFEVKRLGRDADHSPAPSCRD